MKAHSAALGTRHAVSDRHLQAYLGRFRYTITYNQAGFSNHSYRVLLAERSLGHIPRHMLKTGKK